MVPQLTGEAGKREFFTFADSFISVNKEIFRFQFGKFLYKARQDYSPPAFGRGDFPPDQRRRFALTKRKKTGHAVVAGLRR